MVLKDYPELKQQLYRCSKCGYCRDTVSDELGFYHVCPVYKNLRMEHYSGRGRTTIALGLSEGKIRFHKPLSEALYTCLSCGACKEICPEKIDVCGIISLDIVGKAVIRIVFPDGDQGTMREVEGINSAEI